MAETTFIKVGEPITRFDPVGRCIYCNAERYSGVEIRPLSDEHIIPHGLSGTLILPRASCRKCARATGKIEGSVMRTILWAPRTLLNLKTRRPKERPTTISTMATVAGKDVNISLPIADYPTVLFFPRLGPPGILVGRPRDHADMRGMWTYQLNLNSLSFAKYGIQSMASAVMDTTRLSQMFAKIAHSYAVARLGLNNFTPMLLDHILRPEGYPWHFIGGGTDAPSASGALHEISYEEIDWTGMRYLIVRLRLFAYLGAPEYLIVTGRRVEGTSEA